jgi:hypothetical protein
VELDPKVVKDVLKSVFQIMLVLSLFCVWAYLISYGIVLMETIR